MLLPSALTRLRSRILLKGVHFADKHRRLDSLYRVQDPWGLDCEREHFRFEETNKLIRAQFGELTHLVEIGCGEGLQSVYLANSCQSLTGIDVSPNAIARARQRVPQARFIAADVMADGVLLHEPKADLVTAFEVLYYVKDVNAFLRAISQMGHACMVTYYDAHQESLAPILAKLNPHGTVSFSFESTRWIASWWHIWPESVPRERTTSDPHDHTPGPHTLNPIAEKRGS